MPSPRSALVIPAWNEVECIGAVLDEVPAGSVDQVIVVCGHSIDGPDERARGRGATVVDDNPVGYGAACWAGYRRAVADGAAIVAFLDGDYSDPPARLPSLLQPVVDDRCDLALGVRDMRLNPDALPVHARLGNKLVLSALGLMTGQQLGDLPSFKVVRVSALERLEMGERTYGWTTELLVKAGRAGLRIQELPIEYRPRLGGASKVSGTVRGTIGAAWKLTSCAVRYARWQPSDGAR